jgi:unsaturated rhamnogalacturonyl hydrolase
LTCSLITRPFLQRISIAVFLFPLCGLVFHLLPAVAQDRADTERQLRLIADAVVTDATFQFVDPQSGERFASSKEAPSNRELRLQSPYNDWRYWNGVLNMAMAGLGEQLGDSSYAEFPRKNIAFAFDNYGYFKERHRDESKWDYPFGQFFIMEELDDCGVMGANVIEVYRRDHQDRYREYIDRAAKHMRSQQARLGDGTLVRSFPHKWTLWVDDLYMSISFLARMGDFSTESRYFDDAAQQVINFHKYLFNEEKGLMYHCWYSDVNRPGVAFWGRGNGWAILAQVDLLDRLPLDHARRDTLVALFQRHILGIARYQGGDGLWHQLLDKADSYLETSCSAMFTYAVARAVNKGYLERRYASIAQRGWEGLTSRIRTDGQVEGVCGGTGVGDDLVFYYHRPTALNDLHGIGAVLLAGAEVMSLTGK